MSRPTGLAVWVSGLVFLAILGDALAELPAITPGDVVSRYQDALSWESVVSLDAEILYSLKGGGSQDGQSRVNLLYHRDQERTQLTERRAQLSTDGQVVPNTDTWEMNLLDGKREIRAAKDMAGMKLGGGYIKHNDNDALRVMLLSTGQYGGFLEGHNGFTEKKTVAELLRNCGDLRMKTGTAIDGVETYEVTGDTTYGQITIWVAPTRGYNAMKCEISLGPQHRMGAKTLEQLGLSRALLVNTTDELRQIDGRWVGVAGSSRWVAKRRNGTEREEVTRVRRSRIDLTPNFEALGAFKISVPEGTRFSDDMAPGIQFEFHDGELQPFVDSDAVTGIDKVVATRHANLPMQSDSSAAESGTTHGAKDGVPVRSSSVWWVVFVALAMIVVSVVAVIHLSYRRYRNRQ